MPAHVRLATVSDAPAISGLTTQLGYEVDASALAGRLQHILARPDQRLYVADADGRSVGWVHAALAEYLETGRYLVIAGLVVERRVRRQGIGRLLMAVAEAWAKECGVPFVRLSSSTGRTDAHRFYRGLGYATVKTQFAFAKAIDPDGGADLSALSPRVEPEGMPARRTDPDPADTRGPAASSGSPVVFGGVQPILRVSDLRASADYYVRALGFTVDFEDVIVSVSRGRCALFLVPGDQGHAGGWVWIGVSQVDALHAEYEASGAIIRQPPTNFPWACEMQVQDPDGNVLRLGSEPKTDRPYGPWLDMRGDRWEMSPAGEWRRAASRA